MGRNANVTTNQWKLDLSASSAKINTGGPEIENTGAGEEANNKKK
jgi:hypothetical protein